MCLIFCSRAPAARTEHLDVCVHVHVHVHVRACVCVCGRARADAPAWVRAAGENAADVRTAPGAAALDNIRAVHGPAVARELLPARRADYSMTMSRPFRSDEY